MKKILIYLYRSSLRPIGGPIGYNYNLKCQFEAKSSKDIYFIETSKKSDLINERINRIQYSKLKQLLVIAKSVYKKTKMLYGFRHKAIVDLQNYDIVHFHSTIDMYNAKDDLKNYKGKVVLTSHTPTLPSKEIYDGLTDFEKKYLNFLYKNLLRIDEYSFKRADYIIFPCEEAEEPYYHNSKDYALFKATNHFKYRYLLTGINPCIAKISCNDIRRRYKIPQSAFVVCYIGRHNEIKGYDDLKDIGRELLEKNDDLYILVAGKESPLKGLNHNRWIEVGWTDDPYSIINASDVFLLPNKETYFDLILLEVLSLGKIIIASKTGGNKYFERFKDSGVLLFENCIGAIMEIEKLKNRTVGERQLLENYNKDMFRKYFTSSVFSDNYIKLITSL